MRNHRQAVLAISLFLLFLSSGEPAAELQPERMLRLHVRANSDSVSDQALKLQVRDTVLGTLQEHLNEAGTVATAEEEIEGVLADVLLAAGATVAAAGFDYPITATLGAADFPTRVYGGQVYRAGTYRALQIFLGEGRGGNWWCVLFPPLCFVEVAPDTAIPAGTVKQETLRPRSRLVEWWQKLFGSKA